MTQNFEALMEEVVREFHHSFPVTVHQPYLLGDKFNEVLTQAQNINIEQRDFLRTMGRKIVETTMAAVTVEEGENQHSVYTRCWDCLTWGVGFPNDKVCGNCNSTNTSEYWPDCRKSSLDKFEKFIGVISSC